MPVDRPGSLDARHRTRPTTRSEFATLIEDHADRLVRYAFRQVGNVQDAEDIVQDVFARLFMGDRRDQVVSVVPYLYRSVSNACTDLARRRARSAVLRVEVGFEQLSTADGGPPEAAQVAEEGGRAEALLGRLPPEQAEVIRLRVFDGLRLDEIAALLDCSINTVSSRLRYGFQKLRDAVGQERNRS